jgi:excisionase family DNA binding protein
MRNKRVLRLAGLVMMEKITKLLSLDEAASFLGASKVSLRRWTNGGLLECHRIGPQGRRRFELRQLKKFAERNNAEPNNNVAREQAEPRYPLHRLNAKLETEPRRHVCVYFRNPVEQWEVFRRYFLHHYRRGEPTLYIHSASSPSRLRDWLASEGLDFDAVTQSGLLQLFAADEAYLKNGNFSADAMIAFVRQTIIRASSASFPIHLITGEMDWYLLRAPGVEEIHEYERRLNFLQDEFPEVTIVCQYDVSRFDVDTVIETCCTHPLIEWRGQLHRGSF